MTMKKIRINYLMFLGVVVTIIGASCKKDWMDVKSDINQTVPSNLVDFEYLLDDYSTMSLQTPGLAEVGSDGHYMLESRWSSLSVTSNTERNAYTWTNNLPNLAVGDWNESYKRIFQCNLVLDGLKKLSPNQETEKYNRIKGNALFHRAKNEYDLAQIYAQPYQAVSAATDMGIPLKNGINVTEPANRSTVKETYDRIITDLLTAKDLLPNLPEIKTRGSKAGVLALLARTYLTIGDYGQAGFYADATLSLNNNLIDFNTISATATNLGQFNVETIFFAARINSWVSTWNSGSYGVDLLFYNLYDNNDLRKTRYFTFRGTDIIFKGNYYQGTIGFNGLAVDEQYLIRAECFARLGNVTGAMKDLNDLLKTRWNNQVLYPIRTATNAEDALRQVLMERKKELCFRNLRWTDLRRLNLDTRFKETLTRTIGGNTYTLEPGSYKYTLPIPDDVMNLAPQMKQSPGW